MPIAGAGCGRVACAAAYAGPMTLDATATMLLVLARAIALIPALAVVAMAWNMRLLVDEVRELRLELRSARGADAAGPASDPEI